MTTVTKRQTTAMATGAKKALAVVATGALVASLGYFHLWGSTPAVAANDGDQVEVFFNLDNDVTVEVGNEKFDAQSDEGYRAPVSEDLRFTATSTHGDREIGDVAALLQSGAQPTAQVMTVQEERVADEAVPAAEEPAQTPVDPSAMIEIVPEVEPIPETAAALEAKNQAEGGSKADEAADEAADTEVVEDEATPLAATSGAKANDPATEIDVTFDADKNEYVISKDELQKAANASGSIEVTITSDAQGDTFDNWDALAAFLSADGEGKVKLTSDVRATSTVVVAGDKTIDLNGHTIISEAEGSLFKVGDESRAATLTINDSASKYRALDQASDGILLPKPNQDNAGDLVNDIMGEFREKWVGQKATLEGDTLTYYVTRSYEDKHIAGGTNEYQIKHTVNMENVGTIVAAKAQDLVVVGNGASTLNIEGGRLSYNEGVTGDIHAVNMNQGGTFHMSGGFITNVKAEGLGGAVSANSGNNGSAVNITIDGNAVIAGNATKKNGGAIWMSSEAKGTPATLTVSGNAVIAGNEAGSEPLTDLTKGTIATSQNGGGIYARKNCEVTITGSAVIAGNVANADGGGVYIEGHAKGLTATKNLLTIEENATITNNRSENDRTAKHQKDRSTGPSNEEHFWKNYGGGGGGIFTLDETIINGGQITSNFASDGGGGIYALGGTKTIPSKWNGGLDESKAYENALPVLKVENCRISSNYAGTSEGGGICAGTDKASYVKQGIISNNMTATYFDYGGGGLFMSSIDANDIKGTPQATAGITVYHPLVSGNTAAGLGGGVASCTNGVVVSADAAVFGNTALEENCTQNPNEYGDQWVLEGGLHDGEPESYGLKGKIAKGQANDFYCARKSTVFNSMLGGGWYNWTGYTTGDVVSEKANAHREGWNKDNYVKINGTDKVQVTNVLYRSNGNLLRVIVPENDIEKIKQLKGYVVTFDTIDLSKNPSPKVSDTKIVTAIDENPGKEPENDTCNAGEKIVTLYLSKDSVNPADYEAKATGFTLTDAFTTTDPKGNYPLYQVNKLTQTADTCVTGNRLMFLTADPSDEDKAKAEDAAVLFFTGNYSNTHGGAIACNDYIDVGAADKEPPSKHESKLGKMSLTKKMVGWDDAREGSSATAMFTVTGYTDVEAYRAHLDPIYVNLVSMSFNEDGSETKELTDLPLGYYVVEEVFYAGDNFKEPSDRNQWTVQLTEDNAEDGVSHEFVNTFRDENTFGTGVVNSYTPTGEVTDENGNTTGFIYADGKLTYTPDDNYGKRKQPSAPIEGGN